MARSQSWEIISFDQLQLRLETTFETASGEIVKLQYFIRPYRATVEVRRGEGAEKLRMQSLSSFTIIPDLFGDDLVIDPQTIRNTQLYLPEDNQMLVQMIGNGNAMIVCNWAARERKGEIQLILNRNRRQIYNSNALIDLAGKDRVFVSALGYPGIWFYVQAARLNIYDQVALNWNVPFEASWRADFQRTDRRAAGLTDSFWNAVRLNNGTFMSAPGLMEMEIIDGQYVIRGTQEVKRLVRRSVVNEYIGNGWWPFLGWFIQPFYTMGNRAFIKLPKYDQLTSARYGGGIVIYPLMDEIVDDPASVTVEDILRETLGPSYLGILDLAGLNRRPEEDYYPPTCFTTEYVENIFSAMAEIGRRQHIVSMLEQMKVFVTNTHERLEEYVEWAEEMEVLYQQSRAADPNLAGTIEIIKGITQQLTRRFEQESSKMKTPEYAVQLADQVIGLIDNRSFSKIARCRQTCSRLRDIGDAQDELLGELRDIMKIARQRAGYLHARESDPSVRKFLREVRRRTQEILRISYDMEGKL